VRASFSYIPQQQPWLQATVQVQEREHGGSMDDSFRSFLNAI
jgi:hypothetical protein